MRSVGSHHTLAPVVDVVRDSRWGRNEETAWWMLFRRRIASVKARGSGNWASKSSGRYRRKRSYSSLLIDMNYQSDRAGMSGLFFS